MAWLGRASPAKLREQWAGSPARAEAKEGSFGIQRAGRQLPAEFLPAGAFGPGDAFAYAAWNLCAGRLPIR